MGSTDGYSANVVPFPVRYPSPGTSVATTRHSALDICYSVYGEGPITPEVLDTYYEANAIYENPFITATSRAVIGDIHRLSRQLSSIDVPRPLAVVCTLFRLRPPNLSWRSEDFLFRGLRIWTDIVDISETESFDGHHKAIVEHTLNILLLPGIHCEGAASHHRATLSTDSLINIHNSPLLSSTHPFLSPSLPIPGTSLTMASPMHCKVRIISRLSFNEQGLVTHHRDVWDIRDVMGLLPGVSLAQWIGTRIAATGLSYFSKFLPNSKKEKAPGNSAADPRHLKDVEQGK